MPEITVTSKTETSSTQQKLDHQLLLSLSLSPLAAGVSTMVGYAVAHRIVLVGDKVAGYVVSAGCLALCAVAAVIARGARGDLIGHDETLPGGGRQLFMAQLAILLSALSALLVLAGFVVLMILNPND